MRILLVGDVHATPDELKDCRSLQDLIEKTIKEYKIERVVFLGDQFHTHNVVRLEVIHWWYSFLSRITMFGRPDVILVTGNHDTDLNDISLNANNNLVLPTDSPNFPRVRVISNGYWKDNGVIYLSYHPPDRHDSFIAACKAADKTDLVICHQTFTGAKYENGFYAKDGIDVNLIPQKKIISGHIHTKQSWHTNSGQLVWYPGSPRWRTASDENIEKSINVIDEQGNQIANIPTDTHCSSRVRVKLTPNDLDAPVLVKNAKNYLDLEGPSDWVDEQIKLYGKDFFVRAIRLQASTPAVKESEGFDTSFGKFLENNEVPNKTPVEILTKLAEERLGYGRQNI